MMALIRGRLLFSITRQNYSSLKLR